VKRDVRTLAFNLYNSGMRNIHPRRAKIHSAKIRRIRILRRQGTATKTISTRAFFRIARWILLALIVVLSAVRWATRAGLSTIGFMAVTALAKHALEWTKHNQCREQARDQAVSIHVSVASKSLVLSISSLRLPAPPVNLNFAQLGRTF
jgi:hypothetical protein